MGNNFKNDDSFLRKLVVGAAGTNATIKRLKELGFEPIETRAWINRIQNLEKNQDKTR
jgi:hypothetical protein